MQNKNIEVTAERFIKIVLLGGSAFTSLRISICETTALVLSTLIYVGAGGW